MQLQSVKRYLWFLIREAHRWQNMDIAGNLKRPRFWFSTLQLTFIVLSLFIAYASGDFMDNDFIGYIIAALSIFIGLFLSMIISIFDKFQSIDFSEATKTESRMAVLKKTKNYFKQFTTLTTYAILISILTIVLLSALFFTDYFSTTTNIYPLDIENGSRLLFIKLSSIVFYRATILYFLMDFVYIVIMAVTSNYVYIYTEYESKKVPEREE